MTAKSDTIAVALSGGVDSAVTAALLQAEGLKVIGLFMDLGPEHAPALASVRAVADRLNLELRTIPLAEKMARRVIEPFLDAYGRGLTPNPCARCNRRVKFTELLKAAREAGAGRLATGHYAVVDLRSDPPRLRRGAETGKEQSYFLARLDVNWLSDIVFPLGGWTKDRVRAKAARLGLPSAHRPDSQEVCFLAGTDYRDYFIARRRAVPGDIVLVDGTVVGRHQGLFRHTIGQRRGLGVPWSEPLYVIDLDPRTNRLVVGPAGSQGRTRARLSDPVWFTDPRTLPDPVDVQVRYRSRPVPARVDLSRTDHPGIEFLSPVKAAAPGQLAVFYDRDRVLGSGWLERLTD